MAQDDPRAVLAALAEGSGVSLAALSRMLGRNAAYVQQYVRRGTPRFLEEHDLERLATFFGVGSEVLGGRPARPAWRVPRLDVAVSAGPGALVDSEVALGTDTLDPLLARRLGLQREAASIVRVRGDSMEPGLVDGDHILVDTADTVPGARGAVFVIRIDGTTMVKRVVLRRGVPVASSDNPAAPPLPDAPVEMIGRVVWVMRRPV